jgi:hypothetical protein
MKTRLLLIIAITLLFVLNLEAQFAGGSGTADDPWQISTPDHLDEVRNYLGDVNSDKHFILINNIDLDTPPYNSGEGWLPMGVATNQFTGSFDGDDYSIENLFIDRDGSWYQGLFGYVSTVASISNLSLVNVDVTGYSSVGGLVGENKGSLTNCSVEGDISSTSQNVGGIAGRSDGTIDSCHSEGTVTTIDSNNAGGLVGRNNNVIINSSSNSDVFGYGNNSYGGLVGWNQGNIENSHASGDVDGLIYTGGLIGRNYDGIVINCYATGDVISTEYGVGGLVGKNGGLPAMHEPIVTSCYASGDVEGLAAVGGLVGDNAGFIDNSYATGSVWGSNTVSFISGVGGLVGIMSGFISQDAELEFSYSIGHVSGNQPLGGLVGVVNYGIVTYSYWDVETSAQATSAAGNGLTTFEMLQEDTYFMWDFVDIWQIIEGGSYPYLINNPQDPPPMPPDTPFIIVSPESFDITIDPNEIIEEIMTIENPGTGELTFDIYIGEIPERGLQNRVRTREEWLSISPTSGTLNPGDSVELDVLFDATGLVPGDIYETDIYIVNNAASTIEIPVSLEVNLPDLPAPTNLEVDEYTAEFTWDEPEYEPPLELNGYSVYLDEGLVEFVEELHYIFEDLTHGEIYVAGVAAEYNLGESEIATYEFTYTGVDADSPIINVTKLGRNYPNPFNPETTISFSLQKETDVLIEIFNIRGEKVRRLVDGRYPPADHTVSWNGTDDKGKQAGSGVFFYRMIAGDIISTRKMLLLK